MFCRIDKILVADYLQKGIYTRKVHLVIRVVEVSTGFWIVYYFVALYSLCYFVVVLHFMISTF